MNMRIVALLLTAGLLPISLHAAAEVAAGSLPLRTLIIHALNSQPSVAIASWETEMRHQETNMSKASLYPTLDASSEAARKKTDEHDNEQNVENKLTLSYRIADFGVRSSNIEKAEHQEAASQFDFQQELLTVAQKTSDAYLAVEKTRQILAVIDGEKLFYKQMLNDFSELISAGAAMQSDIRKVQVSIDSLSTQELNYRAQLDTQLMMLRNMTGDYVTADNLGKLPDFFKKYIFNTHKDQVIDQIMKDNPTYLSLNKAVSAASADYAAAKSANYPVVDFNAGYTDNSPSKDAQEDDYQDEFKVGVKVGLNLFNGFKNQSESAKFSAKYTQTKLGLDDFLIKTRNSVDASVSKYQTGADSLVISTRSYDNAGKLIELYKEEFKLGQKSLLDFISSRNEHYQANLTMIESQFAVYQAKLDQLTQLGGLLQKLYLTPEEIQPSSGSVAQ
jgi:outer membrane protein TolC